MKTYAHHLMETFPGGYSEQEKADSGDTQFH
jgi:hypothetical protein